MSQALCCMVKTHDLVYVFKVLIVEIGKEAKFKGV